MQPRRVDQRRALLVTGTVGTGKTSVAAAAGSLLARERIPHGVIELDTLSRSLASRTSDRHNRAAEVRYFHALAGYHLAAGDRLILAGVVESKSERRLYGALAGCGLRVCRLRADLAELRRRLSMRHTASDADLQWHLNRAKELDEILDTASVQDFEIRSDRGSATDVAAAVLARVGWV